MRWDGWDGWCERRRDGMGCRCRVVACGLRTGEADGVAHTNKTGLPCCVVGLLVGCLAYVAEGGEEMGMGSGWNGRGRWETVMMEQA